MNMLRRLWQEEEGQDLIEYALLIALIALAVAAVFPALAAAINKTYTAATNCMTTGGSACAAP